MSKLLIEHRASVTLLTLNRPGSHDDFAEEQSSRAAAAAERYQVSEMRPHGEGAEIGDDRGEPEA